MVRPIAAFAAMIKGFIMAALLLSLDVGFIKSLAIASVSAVISGLFLVIAARVQMGKQEEIHREVKDVKRAVGADRRQSDNGDN